MAVFTLSQFLNLRNVPAWNLIRGISQTYNIPAQISSASGDTGWSLAITPAGISINSSGLITADLTHHFSDESDSLTVNTDQGTYNIALSVRDYFPVDFYIAPAMFYSSFRSWDHTERDLFRCQYVSGEATSAFNTAEMTVRSGVDGYVDMDALQATLAAIGSRGVLQPMVIYNQRDDDTPMNLVTDSSSDPALAGFMNDGVLTMVLQNGRPVIRGVWTPSDLNSNFTLPARTETAYQSMLNRTFGPFHAISISMRRRNDAPSDVENVLRMYSGDQNSYPGMRTEDNFLRYNNGTYPTDIGLTNTQIREWGVWNGLSGRVVSEGVNVYQRREHFWRQLNSLGGLTTTPTLEGNTTQHREGVGGQLRMGGWDWAETSAYDGLDTAVEATNFRGQDNNLYNNLVAVLGGGNFEYS